MALTDKERLAKLETLIESNSIAIEKLVITNEKQNKVLDKETRALTESYQALRESTLECRQSREDVHRRLEVKRAQLVELDRQIQSKAEKIALSRVDKKIDTLQEAINKGIRNMLFKVVGIIVAATGLLIAGYLKSKGVI